MANESAMAPSSATGSVTVAVHPLVIMNVSEHWTRVRSQRGEENPVVLGALMGTQKGRNVEVYNSFELLYAVVNGDVVINRDYCETKEEQFKQVFKDLEFLGWYRTGELQGTQGDMKIHKTICEANESPLLLKLNPLGRASELPLTFYESVIDLVDGEACMLFVELKYTLATEEAERIGVDHVARYSLSGSTERSSVTDHLMVQHSAIKMLYTRVRLILDYLKAVEGGELPKDHQVLREINSLCHQLPAIDTLQFREDFHMQCNDVLLMAYLAIVTKGCNAANIFVTKFNTVFDRHGVGRRMRGLMF